MTEWCPKHDWRGLIVPGLLWDAYIHVTCLHLRVSSFFVIFFFTQLLLCFLWYNFIVVFFSHTPYTSSSSRFFIFCHLLCFLWHNLFGSHITLLSCCLLLPLLFLRFLRGLFLLSFKLLPLASSSSCFFLSCVASSCSHFDSFSDCFASCVASSCFHFSCSSYSPVCSCPSLIFAFFVVLFWLVSFSQASFRSLCWVSLT